MTDLSEASRRLGWRMCWAFPFFGARSGQYKVQGDDSRWQQLLLELSLCDKRAGVEVQALHSARLPSEDNDNAKEGSGHRV